MSETRSFPVDATTLTLLRAACQINPDNRGGLLTGTQTFVPVEQQIEALRQALEDLCGRIVTASSVAEIVVAAGVVVNELRGVA